MKKLFSVLLVISLLVAFAACGAEESGTTVSNPSESIVVSPPSVSSEADGSDTSDNVSSDVSEDSSDDASDTSDPSDNSETSDDPDTSVPDVSVPDTSEDNSDVSGEVSEPIGDDECLHTSTKIVDARPATCTREGYSGDKYCRSCGEKIADGETIKKTAHDYKTENKAATCTENGYKNRMVCKNCDYEKNEGTAVKALGHDTYTEGNVVKCKRCGEVISTITTSVPYIVDVKFVSKHQPNSFEVDGVPVLDRLYGKNNAAQMGDTFVYEVIMSDGSSEGFEISRTDGCTATINGNRVEVYITGSHQLAFFSIKSKVADENGKYSSVSIRFNTVIMSEHGLEYDDIQLREYAIRKGMKWCTADDGTMEWTPEKEYEVTIGDRENGDWYSETLAAIDSLAEMGCTKFSYQLVYPYGFQIGGYK